MECLYTPELQLQTSSILLSIEESRHAKALRLIQGSRVLLTSGKGILAKAQIIDDTNNAFQLRIIEIREQLHELKIRFGIALSVLASKDRLEFAIEKLTELGITDIHLIDSAHCQVHHVDYERLTNKAIAALKQSKRSCLPIIHRIQAFNSIKESSQEYSAVIIADMHGLASFPETLSTELLPNGALLCIGPEGGFSDEERSFLSKLQNVHSIVLANRRLRAETAAIALASVCQFHWQ